jgi:hypothetical protein
MNVARIIEAIDDPSGLIHPEKHKAFAKRTHPLGKNPAYPESTEHGKNYEEVLASKQWQKILQKAQQYLRIPITGENLQPILYKTAEALGLVSQAEEEHQEELQQLAINTVFQLPEFTHAKRAYERGRLRIDARLSLEIDTSEMSTSEDENDLEEAERTPAEELWMRKMVQRRHLTNAFIQGSAVSNDFLFEMAAPELDRIHPGLRQAYGIMMVSSELGYWLFSQNDLLKGIKAQTHIGSVKVRRESELGEAEHAPGQPPRDRPVIVATGACFPVLIQEIIKGLTELASLASLPRDPAEREEVIRQADLTDLETWSMILGPKLWDSFIEAIDAENARELTMHLYSHIQRMDVDKFNEFMREVLAKSPKGMQMLRVLAGKIKAELAEEDDDVTEAQINEIVTGLLEDDEPDDV